MKNSLATCLVFLVSLAATAAEKTPGSDNFAEQLPRVPGSSPEESRKAIKLRDGFQVDLVAAEPLIRDPIAVDFDERGRMYVVQLPPYNLYVVENTKVFGSIVCLEDSNGDGIYDKSRTFADDLTYPTAVACWDGGLFVGDAPDLLYMKDTDGDGKADVRKVVFTGFGKDTAGEGHLNSIRWGLDNRFRFSTGSNGGDIKATGSADARPVSSRNRGILFDPRSLNAFELTSGGGQYGMSMDDWGRKFVCSNSVPAQTLMYDDRYIARNPHLEAPKAAVDIAPEGKFTSLFRISPPEPWRVLRTKLRSEGKFRGSDEGGVPFGFFTGATGVTIYRGDAWPQEYRGNLFVGEVANNLVYRATVEEDGLGVVAKRADQNAEFLASRDIWFRPVQFANAPDGTLYVIDMYRELIEGAAFLPPEFLQHLDVASGNDMGRIYRIAPNGFQPRPTPRLDQATTAELVSLLEHPNGWHRDTASRLLYQRQDRSAVAPLKELAQHSKSPLGRVTALYSLDGLASLDESTLLGALKDECDDVRIHAVRLSEHFAVKSPAIREQLKRMVDDESLTVRYQLAFSLGSFPGASAAPLLVELAKKDAADKWMRVAVLSSLSDGAEIVFQSLLSEGVLIKTPHGREILLTVARQIGANDRDSELGVVIQSLDHLAKADPKLAEAVVEALVTELRGSRRQQLLAAAGGKAAAMLADLLKEATAKATDEAAAVAVRVDAIRSLKLSNFSDVEALLETLLQPAQPQPIQAAALETAAQFEEQEVAPLVLQVWPSLSPALRARATETLLSRPQWLTAFLDAIEKGAVARGDIDPARVQLLKQHSDATIAARVQKLFADVQVTARKEVVDRYQVALQIEGDPTRGKEVFKKHCSACHQLEGVGEMIGADLKGIRQRGLPSVLLNILDPNREVKPEFLTYAVQTVDGRVLTGMITAETANSVTIRRADNTSETVQRIDIEQMRSSGLSFMPEGLEKDIQPPAMADLLSYLNSLE